MVAFMNTVMVGNKHLIINLSLGEFLLVIWIISRKRNFFFENFSVLGSLWRQNEEDWLHHRKTYFCFGEYHRRNSGQKLILESGVFDADFRIKSLAKNLAAVIAKDDLEKEISRS